MLLGKLGSAVPSFSWKRVPLTRWAPVLQQRDMALLASLASQQ
jgi:hypothetical protein